jgi:hypothetical protein
MMDADHGDEQYTNEKDAMKYQQRHPVLILLLMKQIINKKNQMINKKKQQSVVNSVLFLSIITRLSTMPPPFRWNNSNKNNKPWCRRLCHIKFDRINHRSPRNLFRRLQQITPQHQKQIVPYNVGSPQQQSRDNQKTIIMTVMTMIATAIQ